jgi:hypothetical protein
VKVSELIERLKEMPQDLDVHYCDDGRDFVVTYVALDEWERGKGKSKHIIQEVCIG